MVLIESYYVLRLAEITITGSSVETRRLWSFQPCSSTLDSKANRNLKYWLERAIGFIFVMLVYRWTDMIFLNYYYTIIDIWKNDNQKAASIFKIVIKIDNKNVKL